MHPVLLDTPWLRLPTYFTCLMVGFAPASFVLGREASRRGVPRRDVMDLALLVVPALLNAAVVMGCLPTKGLTLPFLSYGRSSLVVSCLAVGILLAVARAGRPRGART